MNTNEINNIIEIVNYNKNEQIGKKTSKNAKTINEFKSLKLIMRPTRGKNRTRS